MALVLFYGYYDDFSAAQFIREYAEAEETGEEINMRFNTGGGDPFAGFGMVRTVAESEATRTLKVDGKADSMGFFFILYFKNVQALNTSQFVVHRASSYAEDYDKMIRARVVEVNKQLRALFEEKVNVAKFEEISGVSVDRLFDMEQEPVDVLLNVEQAKEIGVVTEVFNLSNGEIEAMKKGIAWNKTLIAAQNKNPLVDLEKLIEPEPEKEDEQTDKTMTLEEFKAKHPELYAQARTEGITAGVNQERARVSGFMVYAEFAPEEVAAAITKGEEMNALHLATLNKKMVTAQMNLEKDSADDNDGDGNDGDQDDNSGEGGKGKEENKEVMAFTADVFKSAGIKDKSKK